MRINLSFKMIEISDRKLNLILPRIPYMDESGILWSKLVFLASGV
jgi:hypothetical protein